MPRPLLWGRTDPHPGSAECVFASSPAAGRHVPLVCRPGDEVPDLFTIRSTMPRRASPGTSAPQDRHAERETIRRSADRSPYLPDPVSIIIARARGRQSVMKLKPAGQSLFQRFCAAAAEIRSRLPRQARAAASKNPRAVLLAPSESPVPAPGARTIAQEAGPSRPSSAVSRSSRTVDPPQRKKEKAHVYQQQRRVRSRHWPRTRSPTNTRSRNIDCSSQRRKDSKGGSTSNESDTRRASLEPVVASQYREDHRLRRSRRSESSREPCQ